MSSHLPAGPCQSRWEDSRIEWYNKCKPNCKCLYHVIEGVNFALVVLSPRKGGFFTGFIGRLGIKFEVGGLQGLPDRPSLYEYSWQGGIGRSRGMLQVHMIFFRGSTRLSAYSGNMRASSLGFGAQVVDMEGRA